MRTRRITSKKGCLNGTMTMSVVPINCTQYIKWRYTRWDNDHEYSACKDIVVAALYFKIFIRLQRGKLRKPTQTHQSTRQPNKILIKYLHSESWALSYITLLGNRKSKRLYVRPNFPPSKLFYVFRLNWHWRSIMQVAERIQRWSIPVEQTSHEA
jgi:hypothetical protein